MRPTPFLRSSWSWSLAFMLACAGGLSLPAFAQIERQHGAHVHGTSILDVALDGSTLSLHLDAPGINLLGFEHPPRDAAEHAAVAAVLKDLNAPGEWLSPAAAAGCRLVEAKVSAQGLGADTPAAATVSAAPETGESHADFDADYRYECAEPSLLSALEIRLTTRYAGTKTVAVNIASASGQTTTELSGTNTHVSISRWSSGVCGDAAGARGFLPVACRSDADRDRLQP